MRDRAGRQEARIRRISWRDGAVCTRKHSSGFRPPKPSAHLLSYSPFYPWNVDYVLPMYFVLPVLHPLSWNMDFFITYKRASIMFHRTYMNLDLLVHSEKGPSLQCRPCTHPVQKRQVSFQFTPELREMFK